MEEKVQKIKSWIGTKSINIFGLPMSGKDTQGMRLAEALNAKFLSSGMIIREIEQEQNESLSASGKLIPTNVFYEWVLPYFKREELASFPLVLSSIGRWFGEEDQVMASAKEGNHEIAFAINLKISEEDAITRFDAAKELGDRGNRADDGDIEIFKTRLTEFREKTLPVLNHYRELGMLIEVNGNQSRDDVFNEIVEKLYERIS